ncbi:putative Rna-binding protein Nova-2, partial [Cardiosporidium cionae]
IPRHFIMRRPMDSEEAPFSSVEGMGMAVSAVDNLSYLEKEENSRNRTSSPCYVKFLVPYSVAGSIIGRNGTEIAIAEKQTQSTIRLSNADCFFPGTIQRTCVICGGMENVIEAIMIILSKLRSNLLQMNRPGNEDGGSTTGSQREDAPPWAPETRLVDEEMPRKEMERSLGSPDGIERFNCTMVVPKTAVSAIIGKGGLAIRSLSEKTGAKILVSDRENGLMERLVDFTGSYDAVKMAVTTIARDIQDDRLLRECCQQLDYRSAPSAPSDSHYNPPPVSGPPSTLAGVSVFPPHGCDDNVTYPGVRPIVLISNCEIHLHVPDNAIGAIIGKQGSCLSEIMRRSGAKVMVSQKGELVPGTMNRQVKLSGELLSVHHAHALLWQQYMFYMGGSESPADGYSPTNYPRRDPPYPGNSVPLPKSYNFSGRAVRRSRSRQRYISPYSSHSMR